MNKRNFLEIEHIRAGYGKKEVIQDVSFSLETHTLACLMGKNGCGKTTLLKCIAGLLPYEGNVYLQQEDLQSLTIKQKAQRMSYIPQKSGITISLSVLDVVLMGFHARLKVLEYPSQKQRQKAIEALSLVKMEACIQQDFLTLSEGQKQLVILARMLVEDTSLLLLDEMDSALDIQNRNEILHYIQTIIKEKDMSALLCLHDPQLALEVCDQIFVMDEGKRIATLHPKTDSIDFMEEVLASIYGNISLYEYKDKHNQKHFTLLWEKKL